MTANTSPLFTLTPKIGIAQLLTANTNLDGTGTVVTALTGATDGTRIHRIVVKAIVTTTVGIIRFFIADAVPNIRLWKEVNVTAVTPSSSLPAWTTTIQLYGEDALILPASYTLRVSTEKAETFNVHVEGGDF